MYAGGALRVTVVAASKLPAPAPPHDAPFVQLKLHDQTVTTHSHPPDPCSPVWDQTFMLALHPAALKVKVFLAEAHELGAATVPLDTLDLSGGELDLYPPLLHRVNGRWETLPSKVHLRVAAAARQQLHVRVRGLQRWHAEGWQPVACPGVTLRLGGQERRQAAAEDGPHVFEVADAAGQVLLGEVHDAELLGPGRTGVARQPLSGLVRDREAALWLPVEVEGGGDGARVAMQLDVEAIGFGAGGSAGGGAPRLCVALTGAEMLQDGVWSPMRNDLKYELQYTGVPGGGEGRGAHCGVGPQPETEEPVPDDRAGAWPSNNLRAGPHETMHCS